MLLCIFAGCANKNDPGAEVNIYLGKTTNFDPAMAYNDQDGQQFLSLIYEGLTKIDSNGKVVPGVAKSWTVKGNVVEFKLKETRWSDGIYIAAKDFVYAWKTRILDPEFECDAAALLYYVENAVEAKNGDISIDDVKIEATGQNYLTVTLKDACYVDEFLYNCANVALSPVRQDSLLKIVVHDNYYDALLNNDLRNYSWATLNSTLLADGPFYVKKIDIHSRDPYITLERNKYYLTDEEKDEAPQKFVTPYRLVVNFMEPDAAIENFNNGSILYNGNIALASREALKSSAEIKDQAATYSYYFNTENPLFADARVRTALSMAIDRNEIEKLVVFGKAADGLITPSTFLTGRKTSFRDKAGSVIKTTADVDGARELLSQAGVRSGSFAITVRDDEVSKAVAEYVAGVWRQLGFNVTVKALGYTSNKYTVVTGTKTNDDGTRSIRTDDVYDNLVKDFYNEALEDRNFDVLGIDYAMLSSDAFAALARFGVTYSGGAYDLSVSAEEFEKIPGATHYASSEYDARITAILGETDDAKRADMLIEAEKALLADMPIVPLYYMQNAYLVSDNLKNVKVGYNGLTNFAKAKDSTYKYVPIEAIIPSTKLVSVK